MSQVILISGSPAERSKSSSLLAYARDSLGALGVTSQMIGVRDFPAEDLIQARYDSPAFAGAVRLIAGARGLVVATPIYKAAYSGGLKALLDVLPQQAFRDKTILPIATGGSPAHQLAIDYALKPVLSALGASDIQQGVYIVDSQFRYLEDGTFALEEDLQRRLDEGIRRLAEEVKAAAAR
jgi:FMN reductase